MRISSPARSLSIAARAPRTATSCFRRASAWCSRATCTPHRRNRYLFETRRFGPFTTRRIQQIVQGYREMAGITQPLHPHLFRHQMLTYLTSKGLTDAQIQLISGHESKKSLEVYQHLSLKSVDKAYQDAVQSVGI